MNHILFFLFFFNFIFSQDKEYTIENIFSSPSFKQKTLSGIQWIENGNAFSFLEMDTITKKQNVIRFEISSQKKSILFSEENLKLENDNFSIHNYFWSPDENYIVFTGTLTARSLKSGGNIFLYNVKEKKFSQITNSEEEQLNIKFSPNSNQIGFVRNNNLFVYDIQTQTEIQLTFDGEKHILNGHFDWVYEEEFSIIDGWKFSDDEKYIAYWQLDERNVPSFPIVDLIPLHQNVNEMKYPKAGDKNSIVKIGVVNLETKKNIWIDIQDATDSSQDIYIPRIKWTKRKNELSFQKLNRLQNKLELYFADVTTGKSKLILTETSSTWIEVENDNPHFVKDGFIISSEKDGFNHLYFYDMNGDLQNQITKGNFDIQSISAIDSENEIIYFTAGYPTPIEKNLFKINFDGKNFQRITNETGTHMINFSPNKKKFIDYYSNANMPTKVFFFNTNGEKIFTYEENNVLALNEYKISQKKFFQFKTTENIQLNGWMIYPHNFDESKKYPVLVYVYGGPNSQTVLDMWGREFWWHQLLAQKGYFIVSVDNRGTGFRGKNFKSITYKNLGHFESQDQIETAKYLSTLSYIDKSRIGIFGSSYGGYMVLNTLAESENIFKVGISVAPVTNWKFYDAIYTERYMQTPNLNEEGYKKSAPTEKANMIEEKLLLIHGSGDDNVHFQNSVVMIDEMIKHNAQFETMFYPNRLHGISDKKARIHLYTKMTNFLLNEL